MNLRFMIRSEIDLGSCGIYFIYLIMVFFTLSGWLNILSCVLIKSLYIIIIEKSRKIKIRKIRCSNKRGKPNCKTHAFRLMVLILVRYWYGSSCLSSLFFRVRMYHMVGANHDLILPDAWHLPVRHYIVSAFIFSFYLNRV